MSAIAYCLMPNHFHPLLCSHDDELSRRMQRFLISYTKAMNTRCNRTGSLFEGQLQAVHVARDEVLLHLSRYTHLNPVMAGLAARPEDWEFSSYRDYIRLRDGTLPIPDAVLAHLPSREVYRTFVECYAPEDRKRIAHLLLGD